MSRRVERVSPTVERAARAGALLFGCSYEEALRVALEVRHDMIELGDPLVPIIILSGMQIRFTEQERLRGPRLRLVKGGAP